MASGSQSTSLNQDGSQRRARNKLSCAECRRLKLRCERPGIWPCSTCRKRGCADVCPNGTLRPTGRSSKAQQEVVQLAKRLEELEGVLKSAGIGHKIPPPLNFGGFSFGKGPAGDDAGDEDEGRNGASGSGEQGRNPEQTATAAEADAALDGILDGVGSLSIREEDGRTRFLGTSAGSAYFAAGDDESSEEEQEELYPPSPLDRVALYPFIQLGVAYPKAQELERLRGYLPPIEEGTRLAKCYWTYLSFMFEPLEESVFYDDYFPTAYTPHDMNGSKLACVFIILSLGSLFDPSAPSTPNATSAHYFVVCQSALSCSRFLSNNTMAGAQTLQLMANFLFNTHNLQEGGETFFPILGMAMRMLVTMGLHRDGTKWGLTGPELDRRRLVFYELMSLERMQAFISGRPYIMNPNHFDTQMPSNAAPYQIWKWKLGIFLGRVIDEGFSVKVPTYGTIQMLDQELRDIFAASPKSLRCGALPDNAFVVRPTGAPSLPVTPPNETRPEDLKQEQRKHTLEMVFAQIFFYLHKPAFARALTQYPEEPLASPWAASVAVISLETGVYMLAIARSWVHLHPIVNPRWWHIWFHTFAASVAQSSLVIKSPGSMLARHAWGQLNQAVEVFELASVGGAPVSMFVPRLRTLRQTAYTSLQTSLSIPTTLGAPSLSSKVSTPETLAEGTDADLSVLGPTTRLDRRPKRTQAAGNSPASTASYESSSSYAMRAPDNSPYADVGGPGAGSGAGPSPRNEYTPYDSPLGQLPSPMGMTAPWPVNPGAMFAPVGGGSPSGMSQHPVQQHPVQQHPVQQQQQQQRSQQQQQQRPPHQRYSASQASMQQELNRQHQSYDPGFGAPSRPGGSPQGASFPQGSLPQGEYRQLQHQPSMPSAPSPSQHPSPPGVDPFSAPFSLAAFPQWETWGAQGAGEASDTLGRDPAGGEGDQWMWYDLVGEISPS